MMNSCALKVNKILIDNKKYFKNEQITKKCKIKVLFYDLLHTFNYAL